MPSFLDELAKREIKAEEQFFLGTEPSPDFFKFKYPLSSRSAWQIETIETTDNDYTIFRRIDDLLARKRGVNAIENMLMPNIDISTLICVLYKSAKVTDFISGGIGVGTDHFILNRKAKELLQPLNLGNHRFYPILIQHKNVVFTDYSYLRFYNDASPFVDYSRSVFYTEKGLEYESREVVNPVNSVSEYHELRNKFRQKDLSLGSKELYLTKDFPGYDLFTFEDHLITSTFVSKKLKDIVTNNHLTGCQFLSTTRVKH